MEKDDKTGSYELEWARIVLQTMPILDLSRVPESNEGPAAAKAVKAAGMRGVTTLSASLADAADFREELVKHYRRRLKNGDATAARELCERHPQLGDDTELQEELARWMETGRMRRPACRPQGIYSFHPMWVVGVVNALIKSKRAKDRNAAFEWLANHDVMSYATAKSAYYSALRESRFNALLVKLGAVSAEERKHVEDRLAQAAQVGTGKG